jgi:hypothetical protein
LTIRFKTIFGKTILSGGDLSDKVHDEGKTAADDFVPGLQ